MKVIDIRTIEEKFNVDIIHNGKGYVFFGAPRKYLWHFVIVTENEINLGIEQFHMSRYLIAKEAFLIKKNKHNVDQEISTTFPKRKMFIFKRGMEGRYYFAMDSNKRWRLEERGRNKRLLTPDGLPDHFVNQIHEDIKRLELAQPMISAHKRKKRIIKSLKTRKGKTVASLSEEIIEEIAFELVGGDICERLFSSMYSAYCFWRDTIFTRRFLLVKYEEMYKAWSCASSQGFNCSTLELIDGVQRAYFVNSFWGIDYGIQEKKAAVKIFESMSLRCNSIIMSQLLMMNEITPNGLFFNLSVAAELISPNEYKDIVISDIIKSAEDEEHLLASTYFVCRFGRLMMES